MRATSLKLTCNSRTLPLALFMATTFVAAGSLAQPVPQELFSSFEFREIGPTHFGGRISDIEIVESQPFTILVAGASGGLFRTLNNGTTWECIFQYEGTISIGDFAVDQTNPDVIWVGTGESNNQRSSYWGDGVYKTTDGGKTWVNSGLPESHHIGRIVIDPTDSDTVYVAAAGHLYTYNEERGLFKTTDGGQSWTKVLYINEKVGAIDVVLNPQNPQIVYAATYDRLRRPWHFRDAGPDAAIWRSKDGGDTWERLEGGLPSGQIGRIGLTIYPPNPDILYATIDNQNAQLTDEQRSPKLGFQGEFTESGWTITTVEEGTHAHAIGLQEGDVVLELAGHRIESVWSVLRALSGRTALDVIDIVILRGGEEVRSPLRLGNIEIERDVHGMPTRIIGGEVYRTDDGGDTWRKTNDRPIGGSPPYYYGQIRVDPNDSERVYVLSVPLHTSSDGGVTWDSTLARSIHVDHHALVVDPRDSDRLIIGNDGGLAISYDRGRNWDHYTNLPLAQFYAVGIDQQVPYHVYGGTQDNGTWGGPSSTRRNTAIEPDAWTYIGGGDGFYAQVDPRDANTIYGESQFGGIYRFDRITQTRQSIRPRRPQGHENYRFNWNSPILLSHHNPEIVYFGGNRLFKSLNRGDDWSIISDDLSTQDSEKIAGNVPHCTITTIAESAIDPNLIVVGTDDGLVQWSEDGGVTFMNLSGRFPGLPEGWWCSRVECSRFNVNVAYASFTGYREDDFRPLLYRTDDRGATWQSIVGDLPDEPINVVREDPRFANVLWIGTEFGVWVSIDTGATWSRLRSNLPTIGVHDLVIHPRDRELVLATHGRGFWIADISAIQELNAEVLDTPAHLFTVRDAYQLVMTGGGLWSGDRRFRGPNAPYGAVIAWHLKDDVARNSISLQIRDARGNLVRNITLNNDQVKAGLHRITWNLRREAPRRAGQQQQRRGAAEPLVPPGEYDAILRIGEDEWRQTFQVLPDPNAQSAGASALGEPDPREDE